MALVTLPSGWADSKSKPFSAERLVNMYAEPAIGQKGASQFVLHRTPGLRQLAEVSADPSFYCRGAMKMNEVPYFILGGSLYRLNSDYTTTSLGAVAGSGHCSMANNGEQLVIVADTKGYFYDRADPTITEITSIDFQQASSVTYMDGFFVFTAVDSDVIFISGLNDASSYDALDQATVNKNPDKNIRVFATYGDLWIFGTETTQIYRNSGNVDFPFEPAGSSSTIPIGLGARDSVARLDDLALYWLGSNNIIYRAAGYSPQVISTPAISRAIEKMEGTSDAIAYGYTIDGQPFYKIIFPKGRKCFVYNGLTALWHEEESFNELHQRGIALVTAYGKKLVADAFAGRIYVLDTEHYAEGSNPLVAKFVTPKLHSGAQKINVSKFELVAETGVGLSTGQGSLPLVMMRVSEDQGRSYVCERTQSLGAIGKTTQRVTFENVGDFEMGAVFEISVSDPVKFSVHMADMRATAYDG